MRTHVEFRSDKFPSDDPEGEMNPGRYGRRLAEFLEEQLPTHGIQTVGTNMEDWGYLIEIDNKRFPIWIACGNYEEYPDGFLCFLKPSKPTIRKMFRTIDTTADLERVAAALDRILRSDAGIRDVRWWTEEESRVPGE
jgi:hypothetical protein